MTYAEATEYLFNSLPMFQNTGAGAYKPGLDTVLALSHAFGDPHLSLPCVHIAGTNGKGSTASLIAATTSSAGLRTALYTSPHLIDFRERIRVDGEMIPEEDVVEFTSRFLAMQADPASPVHGMQPSFFELTTVMAFEWFARKGVDVAVIETGLGGRLDSTNIVTPLLSVITNISRDHTALLGDTLAEIAAEKAGIIKPGVPVVIGEAHGDVREVFEHKASECGSPIIFAEDSLPYTRVSRGEDALLYEGTPFGDISCSLTGDCQPHNAATALAALRYLSTLLPIPSSAVARGFADVCSITGLAGRWMKVGDSPLMICDTGHNAGGWEYLSRRLASIPEESLHMVIGFVNDKDIRTILGMMPKGARYYFTQASVRRALPAGELQTLAAGASLAGGVYASVGEAVDAARSAANASDTIFIGGSTFVVADLLADMARKERG